MGYEAPAVGRGNQKWTREREKVPLRDESAVDSLRCSHKTKKDKIEYTACERPPGEGREQ